MKFIAFSGSLRSASTHSALLRYIATVAAPEHTVELLDYRDLPHFDGDLLAQGAPPQLEALKAAVAGADGVIIASPEYNHGVPGPLKNALDWMSRPAYKSVFAGKPVTLLSASPSPVGGARGLEQLKLVMSGMAAALHPQPDLTLGGAASKLDDGGAPSDEAAKRRIERMVGSFARWCGSVNKAV